MTPEEEIAVVRANQGVCTCRADHGRDQCGPATRRGYGRCWSCAFVRRCP